MPRKPPPSLKLTTRQTQLLGDIIKSPGKSSKYWQVLSYHHRCLTWLETHDLIVGSETVPYSFARTGWTATELGEKVLAENSS
jgi:hypothetical protein